MSYQLREPLFMALEAPESQPPDAFSPKIMAWGDGLWLVDLRFGLSYLRYRARRSQGAQGHHRLQGTQGTHGTIEEYLRSSQHFELTPLSRAVWACHPWVALLGLYALRKQGHVGRLGLTEPRHSIFYQKLSWDVWCDAAHDVGKHWHKFLPRGQGFDHREYQEKLARLRRFGKRVGLQGPQELERFETQSLQRRFGKHLTRLIAWQKASAAGAYDATLVCHFFDEVLNTEGVPFPWQPWVPPQPLKVSRVLDYGLSHWESVVPMLLEDVQHLNSLLDNYGSDRIIHMQWRLRLHDLSEVSLPIRFRRPYHLGAEAPHFKTLLQQAHFSYEAWQQQSHKEQAESSPLTPLNYGQVFIAWELEINERRYNMPTQMGGEGGLLASPQERQQKERYQELQALENLLPYTLKQYHPCPSWLPETSFRCSQTSAHKKTEPEHKAQSGFMRSESQRPAFMYPEPQKITIDPQAFHLKPLERVGAPWWLGNIPSANKTVVDTSDRQYFRWESPDGKSYWVYQNTRGKWFVHGIFA